MTPIEQAALEFAAERLSSDWPERCQEIVRRARAALASLEAAKQEPPTDAQIDEVMRAVDLPAIRNKDFRAERDQVMTLPEYNEYAAQVAFARAVLAAAPSPGSGT